MPEMMNVDRSCWWSSF